MVKGATAVGRWIVRPAQQVDEMLSSWLYRLAAANRLSMAGLTEMHVQRRLGWLRDIDRFAPVELVENLAATVGKEFVECGAGTFMEWDIYLDNLTEKSRSGGSARWYLKAPRPAGARVNPIPIQYCPECLRDPTPYFRKSWRMSFVTLCPSHDAQLQSTCHSCGTPFFYAATMHAQKEPAADVGLRHCLQCKADTVSAIFFVVDDGSEIDRSDDAPFDLSIVLAFVPGDEPTEADGRAEKAAMEVEKLVAERCFDPTKESWNGISLKSCIAISEDDLTVSQAKRLAQWRLEYMTLRAEESQPGPLSA